MNGLGPCARCGANPAIGYASSWSADEGEQWYCHPDEGPSCYEAQSSDAVVAKSRWLDGVRVIDLGGPG